MDVNSDAHRATRHRRGTLLAIVAIVASLLIAIFWLRPSRESRAKGIQKVAVPSEPSASATPLATPSDEAAYGEGKVSCWRIRDAVPGDFRFTLDHSEKTNGKTSAVISSTRESSLRGTLSQRTDATPLRGQRIEFAADMRTKGVRNRANLFVRADDAQGNAVAFDDMGLSVDPDRRGGPIINRALKGDTKWSTEHLVLNIPDQARVVSFGAALEGPGQLWIDNMSIEVVSLDIPITGVDRGPRPHPLVSPIEASELTNKPRNLDFERNAEANVSPCN